MTLSVHLCLQHASRNEERLAVRLQRLRLIYSKHFLRLLPDKILETFLRDVASVFIEPSSKCLLK